MSSYLQWFYDQDVLVILALVAFAVLFIWTYGKALIDRVYLRGVRRIMEEIRVAPWNEKTAFMLRAHQLIITETERKIAVGYRKSIFYIIGLFLTLIIKIFT